MKKNGGNDFIGNSRHINIRYISVKDTVNKEDVKIEYCPTQTMLADYFTNHSREGFKKYSGTS